MTSLKIMVNHLRVMIINKVEVDSVFPHDDEGLSVLQLVKMASDCGQHQSPRTHCLQVTTWHLTPGVMGGRGKERMCVC